MIDEKYVLDCVSDNLYYILNNPEGVRVFKISKTANSLEHVIHHCKDQLKIENLRVKIKAKDIEGLDNVDCLSDAKCEDCPLYASEGKCFLFVRDIYQTFKNEYDAVLEEVGEREVNLYEKTIL